MGEVNFHIHAQNNERSWKKKSSLFARMRWIWITKNKVSVEEKLLGTTFFVEVMIKNLGKNNEGLRVEGVD